MLARALEVAVAGPKESEWAKKRKELKSKCAHTSTQAWRAQAIAAHSSAEPRSTPPESASHSETSPDPPAVQASTSLGWPPRQGCFLRQQGDHPAAEPKTLRLSLGPRPPYLADTVSTMRLPFAGWRQETQRGCDRRHLAAPQIPTEDGHARRQNSALATVYAMLQTGWNPGVSKASAA